MASLKEIRGRIASVKSTQQITRAMTMVAASKLRRYQEYITRMRPYSAKLQGILHHIADSIDPSELNNPFYEKRSVEKVLIVSLTADKGLCGSFNNQAIKLTVTQLSEQYPELREKGKVDILSLGKKGTEYFKKYEYPLYKGYTDFLSNMDYEAAKNLAQELFDLFLDGKYDVIKLVYNKFRNPIVYIPTVEQFLPVENIADDNANAKPNQEATSKDKDQDKYIQYTQYIYQPSKVDIMNTLIPQSLQVNLYRVMLDSLAAEFGSRMTAMDQATDNAEELIKDLRIKFNKARQAAITKEISEIVGGAQALSNA